MGWDVVEWTRGRVKWVGKKGKGKGCEKGEGLRVKEWGKGKGWKKGEQVKVGKRGRG